MEGCPPAPCFSTPPSATRLIFVCTDGNLRRACVVPPWSQKYVVQSFVALPFKPTNIHLQWDLVCSQAYLPEVSQTIFSFGMVAGGLLVGRLADRYGKKWNCIGISFFLSIVELSTLLIDSLLWFMVIRFMVGLLTSVSLSFFQ